MDAEELSRVQFALKIGDCLVDAMLPSTIAFVSLSRARKCVAVLSSRAKIRSPTREAMWCRESTCWPSSDEAISYKTFPNSGSCCQSGLTSSQTRPSFARRAILLFSFYWLQQVVDRVHFKHPQSILIVGGGEEDERLNCELRQQLLAR